MNDNINLQSRELPEWLQLERDIAEAAMRRTRRWECAVVAIGALLLFGSIVLGAVTLADIYHRASGCRGAAMNPVQLAATLRHVSTACTGLALIGFATLILPWLPAMLFGGLL